MPHLKPKKGEIPPLLHPPLLETIFELRWEIEVDRQSGRMKDPSYPLMVGRLYEKIKREFPHTEDLPTVQVHPEANPYVVRHRMRQEKEGHPLIQIGPGILTINETKNYSWTLFRTLIVRIFEAVIELFPKQTLPLRFIKAELRYVNGIPCSENGLTFLKEKLNTKVELNPDLFSLNEMENNPESVSLNFAYKLNKPSGTLLLGAQMGQIEEKNAFLVQSIIQSIGTKAVPQDKEALEPWLSSAHCVAENCFVSLCKGSLMESFCGR